MATNFLSDASASEWKFVHFGWIHFLILGFTVALPFVMSHLTRRERRPKLARGIALTLAAVLLLEKLFELSWGISRHTFPHWQNALPMQLCDWASFIVIFALVKRWQLPYELAYFWGLSGTFQAILTPDVIDNMRDPLFFAFFVSHCGIVVGVLFLTWGLGMRPRPGSVLGAWGWSQLYLAVAGAVNFLFRANQPNFGYLAAKPLKGSLLDFFGPWPVYIVVLEVMSLVFYLIFYAPFWFADRRRAAAVNAPRVGG